MHWDEIRHDGTKLLARMLALHLALPRVVSSSVYGDAFIWLPVWRGKGQLDLKSPFRAGTCGDLGTVSFGDCSDDGQAEPVSVRVSDTLAADLLQRLKEPLDLSGWDHRTGIAH
jgi:hypothetical protein